MRPVEVRVGGLRNYKLQLHPRVKQGRNTTPTYEVSKGERCNLRN